MLSVQQRILNMIQCFRKEWRLYSDSERTTVCGIDSMLVALQLSVAEVNKKVNMCGFTALVPIDFLTSMPQRFQLDLNAASLVWILHSPPDIFVLVKGSRNDLRHHGDFKASLSEVVLLWNYFLPDKLGILQKNVEAPENYVDIKSAYTSFLKSCNMLDLIDIYKKWRELSLENELISSEQLLEFIVGKVDLSNENDSNRMSQDNEELPVKVKKILYSYLSLLVNSKNDLAFACILNIPERGLGRKAFTDLKHAARKKQMSIFLMAISFIRTIELGGKGYAPSPDDPLRVHVKGLSQFIHFMEKLEEIIGEIPDPGVAGGRILSTIKMHLSKGRNSKDPFCQAVEEVVQDLDLRIKNIKNVQHEALATNITGISPARPKVHSINHGTAYCGRDTVKSLLVLLDEAAAHQPPSNKAQLLFGEECGFSSILMLFRSPVQSTGCSPKPLRQRIRTPVCEKDLKLKQPLIRSQFACTYKDGQMTESKKHFSSFQVPDIIHPVPKRLATLFLQDELTVESLHSNLKSAVLGTFSGNLHQNGSKSKETEEVSGKPKNRSAKRKQVDKTSENIICTNDSEPLQHLHSKRPKTATNCQNSLDSNIKKERKCNKTLAKNKLITGQSKLTQFFRL